MLKKTIMLAMSVAAFTALVVPASALATAGWTDKTELLTETRTVNFSGNAKFNSAGLGAIECQTKSENTHFEPGTTGKITEFAVNGSPTEKCSATGFLAGCQVHSVVPTGLPWTIHTVTTSVQITSGEIHNSLTGAFCPVTTVTLTAGTVTATPNDLHAASTLALSGTLVAHNSIPSTGNVTISGTQTIAAPNAGTYGITK